MDKLRQLNDILYSSKHMEGEINYIFWNKPSDIFVLEIWKCQLPFLPLLLMLIQKSLCSMQFNELPPCEQEGHMNHLKGLEKNLIIMCYMYPLPKKKKKTKQKGEESYFSKPLYN